MNVQIRIATYNDLPAVLEIERAAFKQPWSLASFRRELELPFSRLLVAHAPSGTVLGYLCRWLVAGEMHVLNVAVRDDCRQHGVASQLLDYVIKEARRERADLLILEVRRSNLPARQLYRKFQFEQRRLRKDYYGPGEDALIMELAISSAPDG